jgi:hypothetical protein
MRVNSETIAGILANLYGDPQDLAFVASDPWIPSAAELEDAFCSAVSAGNTDAAVLIAEEMSRLRGVPMQHTTPGLCFGSKAGLWRLQ